MSKFCKICWEQNENPLLKFCKKCFYEEVKCDSIRKPIKQVSDKKKLRIKEEWSETGIFMEIWNEREHKCEKCNYPLQEPKAHNFDHIKAKWMNKGKRLDKDNIKILCFACHFERTTGLKYKWLLLD